jgi:hypothetical protein
MYGASVLISKSATAQCDFTLVMRLKISLYDFDDQPSAVQYKAEDNEIFKK